MSDLSDFTKLVLARLETNPDEFQIGGRWDTLVRGIEAYVRGDKDDRYYRTLWPLDDPEIHVIVAAYRKMYLARLHKDMLKNIVSGDDLPKYAEPIKGTLRGTSPNTVLTSAQVQNQALGVLQKEFDKSYNDAFSNAIVKGEGAQIPMSALTASAGPYTSGYIATQQRDTAAKKILITPTDHKIAHKLGIDVLEYLRLRNAA